MISSSEILDKMAKLFYSESLDVFFTSEFLLSDKVQTNENTQTDVTAQ